jgi:thymidylate kinase
LVIFDGWYYRLIARFINKGFKKEWLETLFDIVKTPDMVVLLDIKPEIAWTRRQTFKPNEVGNWDGFHENNFESFCRYQEKTRQELLRLASEYAWFVVDQSTNLTADDVADIVYRQVLLKFPELLNNKPGEETISGIRWESKS